MTEPNYPHIILSFNYRGYQVKIDRDTFDGEYVYASWVHYKYGCAVAVPCCFDAKEAIRKAKLWIDQKYN